jgi:hypothetical protein
MNQQKQKKNWQQFFTRLTWVISTLASLFQVGVWIIEWIRGDLTANFFDRLVFGLISPAFVWMIYGILYALYLAFKWAYSGLKDDDNND